jgi:hypothetical protein
MADLNAGYPTPNLSRNIAIAHGVKLFFKDETKTTPVFHDLGDLSDLTVTPVVEFVEHFSNHDGRNSLAKRIVQSRSLTIEATLNEINEENLKIAFFGGTKDPSGTINYQFSEVLSEGAADTFTLTHTPVADSVLAYKEKDETAVTNSGDSGGSGGADFTYTSNTLTAVGSGALDGETKIRVEYTVAMTSATKTELFGETEIHGAIQLHVLNNQGGVAQIFSIEDALITPSGSLNYPVDGIQSIPITIRSLAKNGKIGDVYLKDDDDGTVTP